MITRRELISKYMTFFERKGHSIIKNSSLIPENDPTVLFTTAGMHPLVPYLLGQKHPAGKRLCNVQRCVRTGDIECVGDETHHTFFEMLGNWSLGDYWKEESIKYSHEFLTKILKIPKKRLVISIFNGINNNKNFPKELDKESLNKWESLGINKNKIIRITNNWWGPAGETGPCGPDTEMFCWKSEKPVPKEVDLNDNNWVEIWNNVFMQYNKTKEGKFVELSQKNVDTGMGVERTLAVLNNLDDNYLTECFKPIIEKIEKLSDKKYEKNKREMRIIADHIKAAVFIIADGISPSNTEQGYVLRRLIRRAIVQGRNLKIKNFITKTAESVFEIYRDYEILKNKKRILDELEKEENKFLETLEKGINIAKKIADKNIIIPGKDAFLLYQSYGIPIEVTKEIISEWGSNIDEKSFQKELQKHQELSRTAAAGKFKSGLADNSMKTTKLHTAAHLLLAALRQVLKNENIIQKGSNITPERLRLDFSFSRKLTDEEIKKIEDLVNAQIQKSCEVKREEMSPKEAKKKGAMGIFDEKYGEIVSVYTIEDFSKEICSGPHVKNTCELGHFKIKREESSSSGVRRIKAVLE